MLCVCFVSVLCLCCVNALSVRCVIVVCVWYVSASRYKVCVWDVGALSVCCVSALCFCMTEKFICLFWFCCFGEKNGKPNPFG